MPGESRDLCESADRVRATPASPCRAEGVEDDVLSVVIGLSFHRVRILTSFGASNYRLCFRPLTARSPKLYSPLLLSTDGLAYSAFHQMTARSARQVSP